MNKKRFIVLSGFIIIAALSRIIPHPYNFAPIGAMSIFGAAYFTDKKFSFLLPLFAMFVSDLLVNNLLYVIAKYFGIQDPADFCDSIQQPVCRPGDDPFIHDVYLVVMNGFDHLVAGFIFNE